MGIGYSGAYSVPRADLGEAFLEYMWNPEDLIGMKLMPLLEVNRKEASFPKIRRESLLKTVDLKRAANGRYNRDSIEGEDDSYRCEEYGYEQPLDDSERRLYKNDFEAELQASQAAAHRLMLGHELRVRNAVVDTNAFTTGNGLRTDVGTAWSTVTADIIGDVLTACEAVRARTGMQPNTFWVGAGGLPDLIRNTAIRQSIHFFAQPSYSAVQASLADLFGVKQVVIGKQVSNTANEGAAATVTSAWIGTGAGSYAGVMVCPMGPSLRESGFGRSILWTDDSPDAVMVEEYREEQTRSTIYRARHNIDEKVFDTSFAQLLDIAA